jgi:hypothetical protein
MADQTVPNIIAFPEYSAAAVLPSGVWTRPTWFATSKVVNAVECCQDNEEQQQSIQEQ